MNYPGHLLSFGQYRLIISGGPDQGRVYQLVSSKLSLGRGVENDIVLTDLKVSRNHLVLGMMDTGQWRVKNLSDKSPLEVNGKKVLEALLKSGDEVVIGETRFRFQFVKSSQLGGGSARKSSLGRTAKLPGARLGGRLRFYTILILVFAFLYLLLGDTGEKREEEEGYDIRNSQEMAEIIERANKRNLERLKKRKFASVEAEMRFKTAEEHFIRGFRDYQKGKFTRSMEAFQTALASDRTHVGARRYYQLAKRRRDEVIDYHLREGQDFFERSMYERCASSMLKAMILINNRQEDKFQQAKVQRKECILLGSM